MEELGTKDGITSRTQDWTTSILGAKTSGWKGPPQTRDIFLFFEETDSPWPNTSAYFAKDRNLYRASLLQNIKDSKLENTKKEGGNTKTEPKLIPRGNEVGVSVNRVAYNFPEAVVLLRGKLFDIRDWHKELMRWITKRRERKREREMEKKERKDIKVKKLTYRANPWLNLTGEISSGGNSQASPKMKK